MPDSFSWFEEQIYLNAYYPNRFNGMAGLVYAALGVAGEGGEVADEVKKALRDDSGELSPERRKKLLLELGDTLYYVGCVAQEIDSSLEEVAVLCSEKLAKRRAERLGNA